MESPLSLRLFTSQEIDIYAKEYQSNGIVSIADFLPTSQAREINQSLLEWKDWGLSVAPADSLLIAEKPETEELRRREWERVGQRLDKPGLSYRFHRSIGHEKCQASQPCLECCFRGLLVSEECLSLLRRISGVKLNYPHAVFGSMYDAGCFLTMHTDQGNGEMAFVYNLTPNWDPIWGGCLHLTEPDLRTIKKVVTPTFNTLTCFRVPAGGVPHYVSPVFPTVEAKRLAISGWFK